MNIEQFLCGPLGTNCYILTDTESGKSIMIDAPYETTRLIQRVSEIKYDMSMILLTHRHVDHIYALPRCRALTGAKVYIQKLDECGLYSAEDSMAKKLRYNLDDFKPERADGVFEDEESVISFGKHEIKVLHTPGHTAGGVCYIIDDMLFTGDTLFAGSVGRSDFPTGSPKELLNSLRRLYLLEGDYRVFPGHGAQTTLENERISNPYMIEAFTL